MKNLRFTKGLWIVLSALSLSGCGINSNDSVTDSESTTPITSSTNDNVNEYSANTDSNDIEQLVSTALENGTVTQFTESGCTLSPVEDDGQSIKQAATPTTEGNLSVRYESGCEFQLAVSDAATGKTTFSAASASEIKKQTHLLIFGEIGDSDQICATKVIIWRTGNATGSRG